MNTVARTVVINQPSLFPWFGELQKLQMSNTSICLDHVTFQKAGFLCRTRIRPDTGPPRWLTVPSVAHTRSGAISDVRLLPTEEWLSTVMRKLSDTYRRAAYRQHALQLFEEAASDDHTFAVDLAERSLAVLADYLGYGLTNRVRSSTLACRERSTSLIAGLAAELGASAYVYGPGSGGRPHYLDLDVLRAGGVEPIQVRYRDVTELPAEGRPPLRCSMLDLIAHHGPDARRWIEPCA